MSDHSIGAYRELYNGLGIAFKAVPVWFWINLIAINLGIPQINF